MSLVILQIVTKHEGDWTISTHSRHGSKPHDRKHVHITKRGMKGEYSWNDDGTRHDKHKFPVSEPCIRRAKDLASSALGIPANTLSLITVLEGGVFVRVDDNCAPPEDKQSYTVYVRKGKLIFALGCDKGLAVVIAHA